MSTIGEYFATTVIRGIDEGISTPGVVHSFHATPVDGSLELPTGAPGGTGPAGPAAAVFRWEGDITDRAALDALAPKLGVAHAGKAWRVLDTNTLMYWNGTGFDSFADAFGAAGPDGHTNTVTIGTVTTGPAGSPLAAVITGSPPNLTLNLTVPRGIKGRKGEPGGPGPIRSAPDYADAHHTADMVPMWDSVTGKWVPRPMPAWRGPWSIAEAQAWDGGAGFAASQTDVSTSPNTVARLNIPPQDTDWRPWITGGVVVHNSVSDNSARTDAEVRIGSAAGQIVAYGVGLGFDVDWYGAFIPHYASAGMTPASPVGVIPAATPVTLHVVLRHLGSGTYSYIQTRSQICCWAVPVSAP